MIDLIEKKCESVTFPRLRLRVRSPSPAYYFLNKNQTLTYRICKRVKNTRFHYLCIKMHENAPSNETKMKHSFFWCAWCMVAAAPLSPCRGSRDGLFYFGDWRSGDARRGCPPSPKGVSITGNCACRSSPFSRLVHPGIYPRNLSPLAPPRHASRAPHGRGETSGIFSPKPLPGEWQRGDACRAAVPPLLGSPGSL